MDKHDHSRKLAPSPLGWVPGDSPEVGRRSRALRAAAAERLFLQPAEHRPSTPSERWRLSVRGLVQGVGYRACCLRRAQDLGLSGWVRNLGDGSVEVEAEGVPLMLSELQLWCEKGPQGAIVSSVASSRVPPTGSDWFEIRR